MPGALDKEAAGSLDLVFQWSISGASGGEFQVAVKGGACTVTEGAHPRPTTTLAISDADFLAVMSGSLPPMQAYTSGKLKITGDVMKSQLITKLWKTGSKGAGR